jgi:tetratricopeptide (TPR) repeat protein
MFFQAQGHLELATRLYDAALDLGTDTFEWIYYTAVIQLEQGQTEEAVATLRRALQVDSAYIPTKIRLADALYDTAQFEESLELYRSVLDSYPQIPSVHFGAGRCYQQLGREEMAIERFSKACELFPRYGAAHYALGQLYRSMGDLEKARYHLAQYQSHRHRRPTVGDGLMNEIEKLKAGNAQALALLDEGVKLGEEGDLEGAIAKHVEALELVPELLQARVNLIILYGRNSQPDEAKRVYQKALDSDLVSADLHYNFGVVEMNGNFYESAARAFRETLRINPLHLMAHQNLGQVLEAYGKLDEAMSHYREVLKIDPDHHVARYNLGRLLIARGRAAEAVLELEKILEPEDERTAHFAFALATAYVRSGQLEKGLEYSERAYSLAEKYDQKDLAQGIAKNLERLRQALATQKAQQP